MDKVKLTREGLNLWIKTQSGGTMEFTRAVIGDGFLSEDTDVAELSSLVSPVSSHTSKESGTSATVDITKASENDDNTFTLLIKIRNGDTAFYLRELGVMAKGSDGKEVLYAYINFEEDAAAMPAYNGDTYVTRKIGMTFIVSGNSNITANITLPAEVTLEEFEAHVNNKSAHAELKDLTLSGKPTTVTPDKTDNSKRVANTEFVQTIFSKIDKIVQALTTRVLGEVYSKYILSDETTFDMAGDLDSYTTTYDNYDSWGDTDVMIAKNGLPQACNDNVYFVAFDISNDDEKVILQALLYPDDVIYTRYMMFWDYMSKGYSNPKYSGWETSSDYTTRAKQKFNQYIGG